MKSDSLFLQLKKLRTAGYILSVSRRKEVMRELQIPQIREFIKNIEEIKKCKLTGWALTELWKMFWNINYSEKEV